MSNFDNAFRQRVLADLMNSDDPESQAIVRQIQGENDNEARRLSNYALPQRAPHDAYTEPSYANEDARLRNYAQPQPNYDNEARRLGNYPPQQTIADLANPERDALNAKLSGQFMRGDSSGQWQSQNTPFEPRQAMQQQPEQPQQRAELQPNSFRNERTGAVTQLSKTPPMWAGQQGQPEVLQSITNQDGTISRVLKMPAANGASAYTTFDKVYMPGRSPNDKAQADIEKKQADLRHVNTSTDLAIQAAGRKADKPIPQLPPAALGMQQEALDAIGISNTISADSLALKDKIAKGSIDLGTLQNPISRAKNYLNMADESSASYAGLVSTVEKLRNDSLRLNKGVQTEGDSERAMRELMDNLNSPDVVSKQLQRINEINKRGANLQKLKVNSIRANYGLPPMSTKDYENQGSALGDNEQAAADAPKQMKTPKFGEVHKGFVFLGGDPSSPQSWKKA